MANELIPIEFNNQRILTTKQLAEVYGTSENNIKNNFNRNENNFIQGKHYYFLQGDELEDFKRQVTLSDDPLNLKFVSRLYLWTERGANRHCKILDTKKAWEQFDNLEETYFRVKEQAQLNIVTPELVQSMIVASNQAIGLVIAPVIEDLKTEVAEVKTHLADVEVQIDKVLDQVTLNSKQVVMLTTALKNKLQKSTGYVVRANDYKFQYVKRKLFYKYSVKRWEEIPVSQFDAVYADIDSLESFRDQI